MHKSTFFLLIVGISSLIYFAINFLPSNDDDFNANYHIDLKQEGYVLLDEQGDTHWVEFGELEEYFLNDNL